MRALSRWLLVFLAFLLPACQIFPPAWTDVKSEVWHQDAVFYQIFVRSFYDSNGDGIGDFNGITAKLDYLNDGNPKTTTDLGVTGIWLMPIFPSPSYHGYDVTDYQAVNPQYGTLDDFKNLLAEAHRRGIKIIIDFVANHTSSRHPWFEASASGDPQYRDWYIWSTDNPGYQGPWGQAVWHGSGNGFYYGVFDAKMPDLNYQNPAVTQAIYAAADFWLNEVGVDGFRMDGAKHILEEGQTQENTPATLAWLKDFTAHVHQQKADAVVVGEVWSGLDAIAPYLNEGALDLAFNFPLADNLVKSASSSSSFQTAAGLSASQRAFQPGKTYATFLTNHDMPRVMTQLGEDPLKARAAAALLLTAPGVPFIYYGEEIGMRGPKPDEKIRRPMQWSAADNAGFSTARPWWLPDENYPQVNVEAMNQDPQSLLNHYRALLAIRNQHYALRTGQYIEVSSGNSAVFAALRAAEKETILVLVNLGNQPVAGQDLTLSWNSSPLRGSPKSTVLMGPAGGKISPLTVDEKGGSKEYRPVAELAPGETWIVQLRP